MEKTKKIPLRMCVACREMKPKKEMLRIVKNKTGEISLDFTGKAAGRGAYVCDDKECLKKIIKNKLINKVFACQVEDAVYKSIEEDYFGKEKQS